MGDAAVRPIIHMKDDLIPLGKFSPEDKKIYYAQLAEKYLKIISLLEHDEREPIILIINPAVFDILKDKEFLKMVDESLMKEFNMRNAKSFKDNDLHSIYPVWLNIDRDILRALRTLIIQQRILAIPTAISPFPFTHFKTREAINEQISLSINKWKSYMGDAPNGFWLPECAYISGLDQYLLDSDVQFTFLSKWAFDTAKPYSAETDSILQTPRGLKVLPVIEVMPPMDKSSFSYLDYLKEEDKVSIYYVISDSELFCADVDGMKKECRTALLGFTYLGMEENRLILTDVQLKQLPLLHKMEDELVNLAKALDDHNHRIYLQLKREWLMYCMGIMDDWLNFDSNDIQQTFSQYSSVMTTGLLDNQALSMRERLLHIDLQSHFSDGEKEKNNEMLSEGSLSALILSWEYPPNIVGGLSRHVHDLAKGLSKKGLDVHILTTRTSGLPMYDLDGQVHVHRVSPMHEEEENFLHWIADLNNAMIQKGIELFRSHSFDVIHAHDWLVGSAAKFLKKQFNIPLVTTIHATEHGRNNGINNEVQRFIHEKEQELVHLSDELIVCSEYMKEELKKLFNFETSLVIPNGVYPLSIDHTLSDEKVFAQMIRNRKMVFSIGRMVAEKGFETIIEAAEKLVDQREEICFIIAGRGPLLDHYRQMVINRGLKDFVYFIGYISDEERNCLFRQADMAVFPSLYEPFGIVALEAMAAKKPVAAARTGGLKGIFNNENGVLFTPGSSVELADAVSSLLSNPAKAARIAENAYKIAITLFGWERISEKTMNVYEDIRLKSKVEGIKL
ncbi:glycosyltransferase [Falsibacillus albus]|nr:glycosyltransferase [Falsibacillus albus]